MKTACNLIERDHLLVLKQATPKLKKAMKWSNMVEPVVHSHSYERLESESGVIFFRILLWTKERAVMDNCASAGARYKRHAHSGSETFTVYSGTLFLETNGDIIEIRSMQEGGKPYYIDAAVPHSGYVEKDTEFIAITIPGDEHWRPHGQ